MGSELHDSGKVQSAYVALKRMLSEHYFKPGEQIHVGKMAENLKISQTPVREALTRLQTEALIYSQSNRGFFAKQIDIKEARDLYEMLFLILQHSVAKVVSLCPNKDRGISDVHSNEISSAMTSFAKSLVVSGIKTPLEETRELEVIYKKVVKATANFEMIRSVSNLTERTHSLRLPEFEDSASRIRISDQFRAMGDLIKDCGSIDACQLLEGVLREKLDRIPDLVKDSYWRAFQEANA